jgi:hypothetical protein
MKQWLNSLYGKLGQILKEGACSTHSQIAEQLGITDDYLSYLINGYRFTGRTFSEDDGNETFVYWPGAEIIMRRPGRLEMAPAKKPARTARELLCYPPDERPLRRGLHNTGAIK